MVHNETMTKVNVSEMKARLSHYMRLAASGEQVILCERNEPRFELVPVKKPIDKEKRRSAFGMFGNWMTEEQVEEALRPMTDDEADRFLETGDY